MCGVVVKVWGLKVEVEGKTILQDLGGTGVRILCCSACAPDGSKVVVSGVELSSKALVLHLSTLLVHRNLRLRRRRWLCRIHKQLIVIYYKWTTSFHLLPGVVVNLT